MCRMVEAIGSKIMSTWMGDLNSTVDSDDERDKKWPNDELGGLRSDLHLIGKVVEDVAA